MTSEAIPTKDELLEKYAKREPKEFVQYDSFNPPTWPVGPGSEDGDGDETWGGHRTHELMQGAQVRVLIDPEIQPEMASRMLRKIADWIDRDGYVKRFEPSDAVRVVPDSVSLEAVPSVRSGVGSPIKFRKRWGVPEGLLYDGGTWGWDVGGYHGQLWDEKHYACDIGAPRMCWLERVFAVGPELEEICRHHVTGDDRAELDAYAAQAEASFREAAERACAANGHVDAGHSDFPHERGACYCVGFFASKEAATARA